MGVTTVPVIQDSSCFPIVGTLDLGNDPSDEITGSPELLGSFLSCFTGKPVLLFEHSHNYFTRGRHWNFVSGMVSVWSNTTPSPTSKLR